MTSSSVQGQSIPDAHWNRLLQLMERERLYLDPLLMQHTVSDYLSLSNRTLCRIIHDYSNHNFCGFINEYRLEEARRLLRDGRLEHLSIVAISRRSGFNSSGVFYRTFRESAGMSPAAYRRLYN